MSMNEGFERWKDRAKGLGLAALISLIVSGVVSGAIGSFFAARLENSKQHVASIIHEKDQFDASQNNIFAHLGIYTDRLMRNDQAKRDELLTAIITAQLQLNRLRNQLRATDQSILSEYERELDNLSKVVRSVNGVTDLNPVYISAQKILALHDKVAEQVRENLEVSAF